MRAPDGSSAHRVHVLDHLGLRELTEPDRVLRRPGSLIERGTGGQENAHTSWAIPPAATPWACSATCSVPVVSAEPGFAYTNVNSSGVRVTVIRRDQASGAACRPAANGTVMFLLTWRLLGGFVGIATQGATAMQRIKQARSGTRTVPARPRRFGSGLSRRLRQRIGSFQAVYRDPAKGARQ